MINMLSWLSLLTSGLCKAGCTYCLKRFKANKKLWSTMFYLLFILDTVFLLVALTTNE